MKWCCTWHPEICATNHPEDDMTKPIKQEIPTPLSELYPAPPLMDLEHPGYPRSVRSQADKNGDYYSWETAYDTGTESLVRPEFGREADINFILENHGVMLANRPIQSADADVDYTMDLQQAMMATEMADNAHRKIPAELKQKYPTYQSWLNAINSGEYMADLQELTAKKEKAARRAKAEQEAKEAEENEGALAPKTPKTDPKKDPKDPVGAVS